MSFSQEFKKEQIFENYILQTEKETQKFPILKKFYEMRNLFPKFELLYLIIELTKYINTNYLYKLYRNDTEKPIKHFTSKDKELETLFN